jgi:diguanylate cyclase (GGDEF)-like protein
MPEKQFRDTIARLEQELVQAHSREKAVSDLLEKKLAELYTHYHISRTIGSLLDLQEMLRQLVAIIKKGIPFDRVSVYLLDEKRERLNLVFFSGLDLREQVCLAVGEGTPGRIVESGEHLHIHDLKLFYATFNDFLHYPGEEKKHGSYIGVALKVHTTTIGAIGIEATTPFSLTVDDMDFMAIVSHQIAAGIERCRLFDTIQQLSQMDGLTALYNHRVFQERLGQELIRRNRTGKPLSLIMLDIDHFKDFNDNFGHQAGDGILKQLAAIIREQCRCASIDSCCRYGGEEFAIILPELAIHHAAGAAERLRRAVEDRLFTVEGSETEAQVTVSLGVAGIGDGEDITPEQLVRNADEALYCSKRNGRNQVSVAPRGESKNS